MQKNPILINFKTRKETYVTAKTSDPDSEGDYCVASWNLSGNKLYKGNNKGVVTIIDTDSLKVPREERRGGCQIRHCSRVLQAETSFLVSSSASIKGFSFSKDENQFLVNSTDKVIRVYSTDDHGLLWELFDAVERLQWKNATFFGEDYIAACTCLFFSKFFLSGFFFHL
jgi:WD40 repeat protein